MNEERAYQGQLVTAINAELGVRRWSRRHLADLTGITAQTLDRVFLLRRDMNIQQLAAIADALNVAPEYLVAQAKLRGVPRAPESGLGVTQGSDARTLLTQLVENPDSDIELVRRLGEAAALTGVNGSRLQRLQDEIRSTRERELHRALDALPRATG